MHITIFPDILGNWNERSPRARVPKKSTRSPRISRGERHAPLRVLCTRCVCAHEWRPAHVRGSRRPTAATVTATAMTTTATTDGLALARDTIYAYELKVVVMPVIYVAFRLCDYNLYVCPALRNETCFWFIFRYYINASARTYAAVAAAP